jgi:hypothetical protein
MRLVAVKNAGDRIDAKISIAMNTKKMPYFLKIVLKTSTDCRLAGSAVAVTVGVAIS